MHSSMEVEIPVIVLLNHTLGDVDDLLRYTNDRLEGLSSLSEPMEFNSKTFSDVIRFMKGDAPSIQLDCGHQKGKYESE